MNNASEVSALLSHSLVYFPSSLRAPGDRTETRSLLLTAVPGTESVLNEHTYWIELMPAGCVSRKMQKQFSL